MIKTAAIFPAYCALNSNPVMRAVSDCLSAHGVDIRPNSLDCDAAIIWSVLWAGRMAPNKAVYEHYRQQSRPVIVIDVGTLIRGITWKIALQNINRSGWHGEDHDLDPDRPSKLGLVIGIARPGTDILIAAQHRKSLQAEGISDMEGWVLDSIKRIRQFSDRQIQVRPHPRDPLELGRLPPGVILQRPKKINQSYDSFDWSNQYHAIVNHNSGPGVLAAIAGTRPVVDSTSLAWPVAVNISDVELPYEVDRSQWLIEVAHTEYTLDEISSGLWLKRLGSRL